MNLGGGRSIPYKTFDMSKLLTSEKNRKEAISYWESNRAQPPNQRSLDWLLVSSINLAAFCQISDSQGLERHGNP